MNITDIMNPDSLKELIKGKYITCREYDDLRLFNYTEKATYDRIWTPETRQSRGLIVDYVGEIVAWPFDKFFNLGENDETRPSALSERTGLIEITEKLDGSMIAVWWYSGSWHTSTRGSFESEQAKAAAKWLISYMKQWPEALRDFTLICEWCAPDNRIVVRYDTSSCVLIGARFLPTGDDIGYQQLESIATLTGLRCTPHTTNNLETLANERGTRTGMEGWVARWPGGFRVKIKTTEYLRLHRLITQFSAVRVRDVMLETPDAWHAYLTELPEEFRVEAETIARTITHEYTTRMARLIETYERIAAETDSRKAFALEVQKQPAEDRSFLFSLLDGRSIDAKLLASVDLAALGLADLQAIEA